jgi:hypothetical protein
MTHLYEIEVQVQTPEGGQRQFFTFLGPLGQLSVRYRCRRIIHETPDDQGDYAEGEIEPDAWGDCAERGVASDSWDDQTGWSTGDCGDDHKI